MSSHRDLYAFVDLLMVARLFAGDGRAYDKQLELVAECRAARRPFLATMPERHRFRCKHCAVEHGEIRLHFEDPAQPLAAGAEDTGWGVPAGRCFDVYFSALHGIAAHGDAMPASLQQLLAGAQG